MDSSLSMTTAIDPVCGMDVDKETTPFRFEHDGTMCGFCTPGFIMATVGVLEKYPRATDAQLYKGLDGNICRCGTYSQMRDAIASLCQAKKGGN